MMHINDRDSDRTEGALIYQGMASPVATCEHIGKAFVSLDAMAYAMREAFGDTMADSVLEEMGALVRHMRAASAMHHIASAKAQARESELIALHDAAEVSAKEWKAEAKIQDGRAAAITRECESVRRLKVDAEARAERYHKESLAYREQRDAAHAERADWHKEASAAQACLVNLREEATRDREWLDTLMRELGGLTLSQLPPGAYGGSLASIWCDIRKGRVGA